MPWGDRTGPWGEGPRTGRGAGYCSGYPVPGSANPDVPGRGRGYGYGRGRGWGGGRGHGRGRGWGRGFGRGRGWGRGYPYYPPAYNDPAGEPYPYPYAPVQSSPEDELKYLESAAKNVEQELETIHKRIADIKNELD